MKTVLCLGKFPGREVKQMMRINIKFKIRTFATRQSHSPIVYWAMKKAEIKSSVLTLLLAVMRPDQCYGA